jgi:hypothetical protein
VSGSPRSARVPWLAFAAYQLLAIVMTWPLAAGITSDVPGDLGDPLLNLWILAWGAEHAPRVFTGQMSWQGFWDANIFHPEPLALAFSEHLFGQVLQILPLYHLTGNTILCYNLLFLTSFSLSGLGMFLLARELLDNGSRPQSSVLAAAFVAGLVYAFVPFRAAQIAHIQSLSSQWMPLALYGLRRFITTNRLRPLIGGAAALLMQNWSCGYYLLFFSPVVPVFVVHQLWTARRIRDWRAWAYLAAAAAVVAVGTWPFLAMYREAQRTYGFERPVGEVVRFSADVYSYLTSPAILHVWGRVLQVLPKPEGELFFGVVPVALALAACWSLVAHSRAHGSDAHDLPLRGPRRFAVRFLLLVIAVQAAGLILIVFTGGFVTSFGGVPLRATNAHRIVLSIVTASTIVLVLSRRARGRLLTMLRSVEGLVLLLLAFSMWMSLGPVPHTGGQPLQLPAMYAWFYEHVPGFDGLRVPARYAMLGALMLSLLAGFGAARLLASAPRRALVAAALSAAYLAETAFAPMPINVSWGGNFVQPPSSIERPADAPAVYHHLATMDDARVIAEFPFGDISWELRYVYYAGVHWKRLVNGYSGTFPAGYQKRLALLERVAQYPDEAWQALREAGTTHVIVHEAALSADEAAAIKRWLTERFAVEIARFGGDVLYDMDGRFDVR